MLAPELSHDGRCLSVFFFFVFVISITHSQFSIGRRQLSGLRNLQYGTLIVIYGSINVVPPSFRSVDSSSWPISSMFLACLPCQH